METQPRSWFRRGGLFTKYVLLFVGLVVFVLAVNGALETWFMYRETKTTLVNAQAEKAETTARSIEQFMSGIERQLSWVTRASSTSIEQRRADYTALLQQVPEIDELRQLDGTGGERLVATRAGVTAGSGTDYSRDPRFEEPLRRGIWWSPTYFRRDAPFVMIAMAHPGRNAGVTVGEINLGFLPGLISEGQVGKLVASVIGPGGRLLASSDPKRPPGTDFSKLPQVAAILRPGSNSISVGEDLDGRSVLTADVGLPALGWYVFFEQPLRQAFAPIYDILFRVAVLLLMGLALSIAAGMVLARRMVVPIRKLQVGAHRLGANEFDHRIDVRTGDEVEDLADQFNRMAGQLQESYSRLEQKVEERTRDLVQSLHELQVLEELGRAINASLDLDAVLTTIVTRAVEVTNADAGAIYNYRGALGVYELAKLFGVDKAAVDTPALSIPADQSQSIIGLAASRREPISIPDVATATDQLLQNLPIPPGCNAVLVVPLIGQNEVLGALVVARKITGAFPSNMIGLMQTFAHQSVLAIENAQLFRQVDQKSRELAAAHDTVQAQAAKLTDQTEQLRSWNRTLEDRVASQLTELERVGRLQRFLAPQVVKLIATSDESELLKSHRREVTVVFCDLRGFTALTETAEPEEVMKILREYHATLGECIFRYEGTLERFAGDGILILFNDPIPLSDHPQRAVHMAVEMRDSVGRLTESWGNRGHALGFGIGVALGYATLGQVGFEGRLEYAAVGSVTNLAARLCSEAKAGQVLISQRVYGLVGPWVDAAPVGTLNLKGFSRPIPAFNVEQWHDEPRATPAVGNM